MKPLNFRQANKVLGAPQNWDSAAKGECVGLPIINDPEHGEMTSVWGLSLRKRLMVLMGKNIALTVHGQGHPPVRVAVADGIKKADIIDASVPIDVKVMPEVVARVTGLPIDLSLISIGCTVEMRSGGKFIVAGLQVNPNNTVTLKGTHGGSHTYEMDGRNFDGRGMLDIIGVIA